MASQSRLHMSLRQRALLSLGMRPSCCKSPCCTVSTEFNVSCLVLSLACRAPLVCRLSLLPGAVSGYQKGSVYMNVKLLSTSSQLMGKALTVMISHTLRVAGVHITLVFLPLTEPQLEGMSSDDNRSSLFFNVSTQDEPESTQSVVSIEYCLYCGSHTTIISVCCHRSSTTV